MDPCVPFNVLTISILYSKFNEPKSDQTHLVTWTTHGLIVRFLFQIGVSVPVHHLAGCYFGRGRTACRVGHGRGGHRRHGRSHPALGNGARPPAALTHGMEKLDRTRRQAHAGTLLSTLPLTGAHLAPRATVTKASSPAAHA